MLSSVNRRVELFLCDYMARLIDDVNFLPEQSAPEQLVEEQPFAVPLVIEANAVNPPHEVYMLGIHFALQTHADDSTPEFHSDVLRQMMFVLHKLRSEMPLLREDYEIYMNGLYVVGIRPIQGEQTYTSVIEFKLACQSHSATQSV